MSAVMVTLPKKELDFAILELKTFRKLVKDDALADLNKRIDKLNAISKAALPKQRAKLIERTNPTRGKKLKTWWKVGERVVVERYGGYTLGKVEGIAEHDHKHMLRVKLNSGKALNLDHGTVHHLSPFWHRKALFGPRPVEPKRTEPTVHLKHEWGARAAEAVALRTEAVGELAAYNENEQAIIYELKRIGGWYVGMARLNDRQGIAAPVRLHLYPEHLDAIIKAGYTVRSGNGLSIPVIPEWCADFKWRILGAFAADGTYHEVAKKIKHRKVELPELGGAA